MPLGRIKDPNSREQECTEARYSGGVRQRATSSVCWDCGVHAFCSMPCFPSSSSSVQTEICCLSSEWGHLALKSLHWRKIKRNLMRIVVPLWPLQIIHLVAKPNLLSAESGLLFLNWSCYADDLWFSHSRIKAANSLNSHIPQRGICSPVFLPQA